MCGDVLKIVGLVAHGFHGVHQVEKRQGQKYIVDLSLFFKESVAEFSDDLSLSVDYSEVAGRVVDYIVSSSCDLIETLAHKIALGILDYQKLRAVEVTVYKPSPPAMSKCDAVSVTVKRFQN